MKFRVVFADWRSRVGRTEEWREARRENFPSEDAWRREYPDTLEDVLLAAEESPFAMWAIRQCIEEYDFPAGAEPGRRYIKMWDQGRQHDAFVGVVIDITRAPYRLVDFRRLVGKSYLVSQAEVVQIHKQYPGITYVGDDNASLAIVENLNIPASHFLVGSLKSRCIMALKVALEKAYIRLPGEVGSAGQISGPIPQMIFELQSYLWDDKGLVQDCVMALANALYVVGPPINVYERPTVKETVGRSFMLRTAVAREAVRLPVSSVGRHSRRIHRMEEHAQSELAEYLR